MIASHKIAPDWHTYTLPTKYDYKINPVLANWQTSIKAENSHVKVRYKHMWKRYIHHGNRPELLLDRKRWQMKEASSFLPSPFFKGKDRVVWPHVNVSYSAGSLHPVKERWSQTIPLSYALIWVVDVCWQWGRDDWCCGLKSNVNGTRHTECVKSQDQKRLPNSFVGHQRIDCCLVQVGCWSKTTHGVIS